MDGFCAWELIAWSRILARDEFQARGCTSYNDSADTAFEATEQPRVERATGVPLYGVGKRKEGDLDG